MDFGLFSPSLLLSIRMGDFMTSPFPFSKSGTLTPNVVEKVKVKISGFGDANRVGVINRSRIQGLINGAVIWARTDDVDPEIKGDSSYPVFSTRIFDCIDGRSWVEVRMISDQAVEYTLEGGENGS